MWNLSQHPVASLTQKECDKQVRFSWPHSTADIFFAQLFKRRPQKLSKPNDTDESTTVTASHTCEPRRIFQPFHTILMVVQSVLVHAVCSVIYIHRLLHTVLLLRHNPNYAKVFHSEMERKKKRIIKLMNEFSSVSSSDLIIIIIIWIHNSDCWETKALSTRDAPPTMTVKLWCCVNDTKERDAHKKETQKQKHTHTHTHTLKTNKTNARKVSNYVDFSVWQCPFQHLSCVTTRHWTWKCTRSCSRSRSLSFKI